MFDRRCIQIGSHPESYAQASVEPHGNRRLVPSCGSVRTRLTLKALKWFSLEITRDEWPWVFERSS